MNLMQLKYFNAVCIYGTVSGAAEFLHIAQPSVSNAIKELENEFGVLLFKRQHRGMVLTSEGDVLYKMSRNILESAESAEKIMRDLGRERKTLKLGVPPMTGALILPNIYRDFLAKNENITLEIIECGRQEMNRKIWDDQLDMAFISHNQQIDPALASVLVGRLEIVCGTTKDNRLASMDDISPFELCETPLVMLEDGFFQTSEIKRWFAKEGIEPNVIMHTAQLSTMLSIISSDTAAGFIFKKLIEKNSELISVSITPPISVNISLVWKKDKYLFSSMRKFKDFVIGNNLFE